MLKVLENNLIFDFEKKVCLSIIMYIVNSLVKKVYFMKFNFFLLMNKINETTDNYASCKKNVMDRIVLDHVTLSISHLVLFLFFSNLT